MQVSNSVLHWSLLFQQHSSQPAWFSLQKCMKLCRLGHGGITHLTSCSVFSPPIFKVKVTSGESPRNDSHSSENGTAGRELPCPTSDRTEAKWFAQDLTGHSGRTTAQNTGFHPKLTKKPFIIFKRSGMVFVFHFLAQVLTIHSMEFNERQVHLRPQLKSAQHLETLDSVLEPGPSRTGTWQSSGAHIFPQRKLKFTQRSWRMENKIWFQVMTW